MSDCFISYTGVDEELAVFIYDHLRAHGLDPFLASISLQSGDRWTAEIVQNLRQSRWVIFLASRAACESPYVQQEVGGAFFAGKKIVPVIWDMSPSELPGWAGNFQALDLRGATVETLESRVRKVAEGIRADKRKGVLIAGGILAGLLLFSSSSEE